ncbi:hypothetical protein FRUB_04582 [Fimbriiglobus ruber]|uniref:Uncharacterized protein n=1 Tax=Fimbriiglobus ruber TaxID=1908690 RepID=A0A225D2Q4_9BACT|nr:hypothetical protein FRUB_09394 [Fimbriiglobus ruber]OWK35757.1 hypothetical protein FRUB_08320 [Fimbriiglobus ruber]OWK41219.1 hypothetical protein FRUB_04582 [Fimbriiglobus ruber]
MCTPASRPYLPSNRAHVCVSPGFPRGVGFLGNPSPAGRAVDTCSGRVAPGELDGGYFVPHSGRVLGEGPCYSPGYFVDACGCRREDPTVHHARFGPSP